MWLFQYKIISKINNKIPWVIVRVWNHKYFQLILCRELAIIILDVPALLPNTTIWVVKFHLTVQIQHLHVRLKGRFFNKQAIIGD